MNKKTGKYRYEYEIIDSDFVEVAPMVAIGGGVEIGAAVIDCYEKRELQDSIPLNLALAFKYIHQKCNYSIKDIIESNRKYNDKFSKYEVDVMKYLLLT